MASKKSAKKLEKNTDSPGVKSIVPKKDWRIFSPPDFDIQLEKGVPASVPAVFIAGLKTENVI